MILPVRLSTIALIFASLVLPLQVTATAAPTQQHAAPKASNAAQAAHDAVARRQFRQWAIQALASIDKHLRKPNSLLYFGTTAHRHTAFAWATGIHLEAVAQAAAVDPKVYVPAFRRCAKGLARYWYTARGFGAYGVSPAWRSHHPERYYDDNAWIALGFISAYQATHDPAYLRRAQATSTFVFSGRSSIGGISWREARPGSATPTINTCSTAPAALAALRLYQITGHRRDLRLGQSLLHWLVQHLQAPNALFYDSITRTGHIHRAQFSYNAALPLQCDLALYQITGRKSYLAQAQRIAVATKKKWYMPKRGTLGCAAFFGYDLTNAWLDLYRATGDRSWLDRTVRVARYVHQHTRLPNGLYTSHWGSDAAKQHKKPNLRAASAVAYLYWRLANPATYTHR